MKGVSELFSVTLLLVLVIAVLGYLLVAMLNQSGRILGESISAGKCVMRVVEVVEGASTAYIFVYNHGDAPCRVVRIYAVDERGSVVGVVYDTTSNKNICYIPCSEVGSYVNVTRGSGDVCIPPKNTAMYRVDLGGLSGVAGFRIVDACGYWVEWP